MLHPAGALTPLCVTLAGLLRLLSPDVERVQPSLTRRAVEALTALGQDSRAMQELVRGPPWRAGGRHCVMVCA
jgi:hypothetical protein